MCKDPLHHNQQPKTVDLCFDIVYPKFSPKQLNVAAEIKTTGQNRLLLIASVSCSLLNGAALMWSSAVAHCVVHSEMLSAYLGYNK